MVLKTFKSYIKNYPLDVSLLYKKSLDSDPSTDEPEESNVIEPNISVKNAFDPKDLFKKKSKSGTISDLEKLGRGRSKY